MESLDAVVIGAGVIGLSIARALALSGREVTVLDAEPTFGSGISSRNSEVIHAGIYYEPGSLKARLCVLGKRLLYQYCEERSIPHKRLGKLIVATNPEEVTMLGQYLAQSVENGVTDLRLLSQPEIAELEPEVQATSAVYSPSTGIVDSHQLMLSYISDIERCGGAIVYRSRVSGGRLTADRGQLDITDPQPFSICCKTLINAAGLYAQQVARSLGVNEKQIPQAYYAKGHYFGVSGASPFSHLIYPIASSAGLGIHVTLDLNQQARFGPDVQWVETPEHSFDTSRKSIFAEAIQRYYPGLDPANLQPSYTGIRPKIVGPGCTPADFQIEAITSNGATLVNCFGIESPGLTASLALGEYVSQIAG